jgi:hypothetical protein
MHPATGSLGLGNPRLQPGYEPEGQREAEQRDRDTASRRIRMLRKDGRNDP